MSLKYTLLLACLAIGAALTGCSDKKIAGETEVFAFCAGQEYQSDKNAFRVTGTGTSMARETAKKKARSNAENALGRTINATIQVVSENYVNSTTVDNKESMTETFNDMGRTVANQLLSGAIVICERYTQKADGNYVCYMAVELSATDLVSKYNERLSQDERILAEYNYEKFKETFEAEMSKQR